MAPIVAGHRKRLVGVGIERCDMDRHCSLHLVCFAKTYSVSLRIRPADPVPERELKGSCLRGNRSFVQICTEGGFAF